MESVVVFVGRWSLFRDGWSVQYYAIIDFWAIGYDVISTRKYRYWPPRSILVFYGGYQCHIQWLNSQQYLLFPLMLLAKTVNKRQSYNRQPHENFRYTSLHEYDLTYRIPRNIYWADCGSKPMKKHLFLDYIIMFLLRLLQGITKIIICEVWTEECVSVSTGLPCDATLSYHRHAKDSDTRKIAVIIPESEQLSFTIDKYVKKL